MKEQIGLCVKNSVGIMALPAAVVVVVVVVVMVMD